MRIALEIILQSSSFILLLLALRPLLKKALSARVRYALWLIPLLRLALPISIKGAFSIWNHMDMLQINPTTVLSSAGLISTAPLGSRIASMNSSANSEMAALASQEIQGILDVNSIQWNALLPHLALLIWLIGVIVMLTWSIVTNYRFYRSTRRHKQMISFGRLLPIYLADDLPSPCLAGVLRPRILVNNTSLQSQKMLDMVILHEMTHFHHGDNLWALFRTLLLCLWWWNPFIWAASKYSREDCEAACDEAVIHKIARDERQIYGMSLIELMRQSTAVPQRLIVDTCMSSGKKQIEERIKMLKREKRTTRWFGFVMVLIILLTLPFFFTSSSYARSDTATEPTDSSQGDDIVETNNQCEAQMADSEWLMMNADDNRQDYFSKKQISNEEEAIETANLIIHNKALIPSNIVVTSKRAMLEKILKDEEFWYVVYFAQELPPPYLVITINPKNGEMIGIDKGNYVEIRERWEKELGPWRAWSLDNKAVFDRMYFENLDYGARMPDNTHLSQENATKIAHDALREYLHLKESEIRSLEVSYSFRNDIMKRGDGCGWVVAFYSKENKKRSPTYQVNIAADNGEVILVYPDPNSHG